MSSTPEPKSADPPTLREDLEKARRFGTYILLFSLLPSLTLPGLVAKLLQVEELIDLWRLIAATAPLTAAIAVVGIAFFRRIEPQWLIVIAAFALLGSLFLGLLLGDSLPVSDVLAIKNHQLPQFIFAMLSAYYRHYGGWSFATSILVGGWLAWVWSKILWPRMTSLRSKPSTPA